MNFSWIEPTGKMKGTVYRIFFLSISVYFLSVCNGKRVERLLPTNSECCETGVSDCRFFFLLPGDDGRDSVVQPIIFDATDLKSKLGNTVGKSRKEGNGRNLNTNKLKSKELDSKHEEHTTKILHAPSWNCSVPSTHRNLCFPIFLFGTIPCSMCATYLQ